MNDAYHSLSIEGYCVSRESIERAGSRTWNRDGNTEDRDNRNALAARGYYDAFRRVKENVEKVLNGANAGRVASDVRVTGTVSSLVRA